MKDTGGKFAYEVFLWKVKEKATIVRFPSAMQIHESLVELVSEEFAQDASAGARRKPLEDALREKDWPEKFTIL